MFEGGGKRQSDIKKRAVCVYGTCKTTTTTTSQQTICIKIGLQISSQLAK